MLAISPGPDNIFVLSQSLVFGKKLGLAIVFGLMTGCLVHISLVAFGLSSIIIEHQTIFFCIKLFGATYLLYIAYNVFKSDAKIQIDSATTHQGSALKLFKTGFIMNVLNPKVSIFFVSFFPKFLFSDTLSTVFQFYILGGLFIAVSMIVFTVIALSSGIIANYIKHNPNIGVYFKWLQMIVFITVAVFILLP